MKHIIEISRDRLKPSDEYRASELNNRNPLLRWKEWVGERQIQQERIKRLSNIILKVYQVFKIRLEDIYTSLLILDSETSPEEQVQELLNKMDM